ncbi:hypothetical protein [Cyanobium sp. ATX-6F1]|uniref:hypothetical protein n=1 Tax=Cyanobium sp. ATX-6F1 TaxID=3137388 RepID=UPI0039BE5BD8
MVESNDTSTHLAASPQRGAGIDHPVDDRLAVLRFPRLQERGVFAGFDEITFRIHPKQPGHFTLDLTTDQEGSIEPTGRTFQVGAIPLLDRPHGIGHQAQHIEHRPCRPQVGVSIAGVGPLTQQADHRLGAGQAAGAEQHQHPIASALEHRHLAEAGEIIHTRMGA